MTYVVSFKSHNFHGAYIKIWKVYTIILLQPQIYFRNFAWIYVVFTNYTFAMFTSLPTPGRDIPNRFPTRHGGQGSFEQRTSYLLKLEN